MPAHFDETWDKSPADDGAADEAGVHDGAGHAMPRFLSHERVDVPAPAFSRLITANGVARSVAVTAVASAALLASVYLSPDSTHTRADMTGRIDVMPVRIVRQDELAEAALRERLSFARGLLTQRAAAQGESTPVAVEPAAALEPLAATSDLPASPAAEPDTATLLLVRNVPEGATFSDGAPAGLGVWALGGQDAKDILTVVTLPVGASPLSQPVTADVDLISASGVTLSSQKIELHAAGIAVSAPLLPAATSASEKALMDSSQTLAAEPQPTGLSDRPATASASGEDAVKPKVKRKKPRVEDAYRAPKTKTASVQSRPALRNDETPSIEPQGPIAKFFAWLKGGQSSVTAKGGDPETAMSESQRGMRQGLGMVPDEN